MSKPKTSDNRILIVTRNLPPLIGGMERLNLNMAKGLAKHNKVAVIGPSISRDSLPANVQFSGAPLTPIWLFLLYAQLNAIFHTFKLRPTHIIAGSGLTAPIALVCAKLIGAKAITYTHGLDVAVAHPLYKRFWIPSLRRMNTVIANSKPTKALLVERGILESKIVVIHPGVDIPEQQPSAMEVNSFKQLYGLQGGPVLLSVGRLTTRKGLKEFVAKSLADIAREFPTVKLLIVGETPQNSLYAKAQTKSEILEEAGKHGLTSNLVFTGNITDLRTLQIAYAASDVHVFPVREIQGDPEGFGMVAIEAAACGTPTAGFSTGGTVDSVAESVSGHLASQGNYQALSEIIKTILKNPTNKRDCLKFAESFSWDNFKDRISAAIAK
ncbi:glycosyltransferase family 4 protein [Gilvimarinus algae]|uniref:Glycosyltransferase family 4 protein n=1 Tax=Gilvimarinus algae TaxID=3058037 RepID=A0ABT8TFP5_9GAMM|nr:glycosyltransferase family 4 protein [Gilvimarinus sp. SDUM040014]MDO3382830.1 glycosyltransferase family 4 protein [Gilvimarinus sp. SDUM040014]